MMKFLCDVHISYKFVAYLSASGFEAIHVNQILEKWHTKDQDICDYADKHDYIVVTKDVDFRNSFFVKQSPKKLIRIKLGNISNDTLIAVFDQYSDAIQTIQNIPVFLLEFDSQDISIIKL